MLSGDPGLGPLQENGTHALLPGSILEGRTDIGAYPVQQEQPPTSVPETSSWMSLVVFGVGSITIAKRKLSKIKNKTEYEYKKKTPA